MQCPVCSANVPFGANFCPDCGSRIPRCSKCNQLVSPDASFCSNCGHDLRDPNQTHVIKRPRTQPRILRLQEFPYAKLFDTEIGPDHIGLFYRLERPAQRYLLIAQDNTIGAATNNAVVVDDAAVSGNHAILLYRDGQLKIQDTASTNGTFLNGEKVQRPMPVGHGDTITLADIDFGLWLKSSWR